MKYFIVTYGCQMNKSDSERVAAVLENIGYRLTLKENEADLIVVNMCSVRQSAVDRVYGLIPKLEKLKAKNKKLKTILTGCILKEDKRKFIKGFNLILNIKNLPNLPKLLGIKNYKSKVSNYLKIQPKYRTNFPAFIPISNGCNNFCSYCVVPYVREFLTCRDHKEILAEIKSIVKKKVNPIRNAISNGAREIWLLGQNVNDYQSPTDYSIDFAKILKMIDDIPGEFKILFISPHPMNFSDELIDTLAQCKKFGKYLNLPVQSGDDKILKKMNRNYTIKEYKKLVQKIRKKIPKIKLSTDVIVGFPSETEKQFQNTVKLFREIKFDNAYIAKYSPRPGTAAFKMKDNVPWIEKKKREKILREVLKT